MQRVRDHGPTGPGAHGETHGRIGPLTSEDAGALVREQALSAVLSDFARTMLTDFHVQGILDELVGRIVEMLPITGAGVTLISPMAGPRYVSASDGSALRFEELQTELGEGPCWPPT